MKIPSNKIIKKLYIESGKLVYANNGIPYSGYYHMIDGIKYAGIYKENIKAPKLIELSKSDEGKLLNEGKIEQFKRKDIKLYNINSNIVNINDRKSILYIHYNSVTKKISQISKDKYKKLKDSDKRDIIIIDKSLNDIEYNIMINNVKKIIPNIEDYLKLFSFI